MPFDKTRFARLSLDLTPRDKERLDRFCRIMDLHKSAYLRAALREKMREDQRRGALRNRKRSG
jgi:hypothetical protein